MLGFTGTLSSIPMGKVTKSLLVCATPRSGSTLLCALLEGTGVAGRPQEFFERLAQSGLPRQPREYFPTDADAAILELLAPLEPPVAAMPPDWRAVQTAEWRAGDRDADVEPVFHAGAIAHLKRRQEAHAAAWRRWFAERGIEPLEVVYEAFAEAPQATVCEVLDHIGVPSAGIHVPEPPLRRQADARSQDWVDRFREEVAA